MMYAFRCGRFFEVCKKRLIFYKERLHQLFEPFIFHAVDIGKQLLIHHGNVLFADRKIVGRLVFALTAQADSFNIDLVCALKTGHIAIDLNIIQAVEIIDARTVGIPNFAVYRAGLILQDDGFIRLTILRHSRLFMLTQINIEYSVAFFIILNKFHFLFLFSKNLYSVDNAAQTENGSPASKAFRYPLRLTPAKAPQSPFPDILPVPAASQ